MAQTISQTASAKGPSGNGPDSPAETLNALLADTFALYLKTKNFHRHVSGPHFRDYHLLLDEQALQILAMTDLIAERVRKIGGTTVRSIGDIARRQRIRDNDVESVGATAMLDELRADNRQFAESLRDAKDVIDAARDYPTSGMIDGWIDEAEQRAWFLGESIRGA